MRKLLPYVLSFCFFAASAQNVGIGTSTPLTRLDINGAISARFSAATATGANTAIPANVSLFRLLTGSVTTTLAASNPQDGQFLTIINEGSNAATFSGYVIPGNNGVGSFVYVGASSAWRQESNNNTGTNAFTAGNGLGWSGNTLNSNISGTANQVNVAGGGTITLSTPQDIATSSNVQFNSANLNTGTDVNSLNANRSVKVGATSQTAGGAGGGAIRYNAPNIDYSDGSTWKTLSTGGTVTGVTGTSPISVTGTTAPIVSIANAAANGATKGAASFNANDFDDNGSGNIGIDYTNAQKASTSNNGILTSTDWNTFNNKPNGSGTVNTMPKWTGTSTLGNSQVTDNGSTVGINSANTSNNLQVNGSVGVYDDVQNIDSRYMGGTIEKGWTPTNNLSYPSITDAPMGNIVTQTSAPTTWVYGPRLTLDLTKDYLVEGWIRATGGSPAAWYFCVQNYDNNGNNISGDGTDWHYPVSGATPPATWTKYSFIVGPNGVKNHSPSAKYISVGWIANYTAGNATYQFCGWRIKPYDKPITSSGGTFTPGSVIFAGAAGQLAQNNANVFWDNTNNRLGVGTATPVGRLDVSGTATDVMYLRSSAAESDIDFEVPSGGWQVGTNASGNGTGNNQFYVYGNGTGYITTFQRGTGNVGIGTTAPGHRLHVVSGSGEEGIIVDAATYPEIIFQTAGSIRSYIAVAGNAGGFGTGTLAGSLILRAESPYAHIITGGGNVALTANATNIGIGTTTPAAKLQVAGGSQTSTSILTDGYIEDISGVGNYVPSHTWTLTGGTVGIFNENGSGSVREWGDGPFGNRCLLWKAYGSSGGADGGWNTNSFNIDHTKTYRVSVWVKRTSQASGTTYFGCQGSDITYLTGAVETNPYFYCGGLPDINKWYLMVGYIHGSGDGSTTNSGGIYDGVTGQKVHSLNGNSNCTADFKFTTSATQQQQRAYLYYNSSAAVQQWFWDPRFEEVNGKEPTISALLPTAAINGTQSFVGDKAIGNELSVGSLGSVTWTQIRSVTITKTRSDTPIVLSADFKGITQNNYIVGVARIRRSGTTIGWNMGGTSCNGCATGTTVTAYETGLAAGSYTYTLEYCSTCSSNIGSTLTAVEVKQ